MDALILSDKVTKATPKVRAELVKRSSSWKDLALFDLYVYLARSDTSSIVRREAVSALGRLHDRRSLPTLYEVLKDKDPKVIAQAMRALLLFKSDQKVLETIQKLSRHENEMIRETAERILRKKNETGRKDSHASSIDELKNLVVLGDVEEVLKKVRDESIHLTFTSPPYYNARDYTFYKSYQEYLDFLDRIFQEIHRVTKEGRFFILNTSPVIVPRVSRQHASKRYPIPYDLHARLVSKGWEFIDDIVWVKPEASVKNRVGGFYQHRKPLGYKPNTVTEMVMVYRKKTSKLLDWNIRNYSQSTVEKSKVTGEIDSSNIWRIDPKYDKKHSAVFPQKLCEKIIKYYSYADDLVFDPFAGSGTFGVVAALHDRHFFLTEIDSEYFDLIKERIDKVTITTLFEGIAPRFAEFKEFKEIIASHK